MKNIVGLAFVVSLFALSAAAAAQTAPSPSPADPALKASAAPLDHSVVSAAAAPSLESATLDAFLSGLPTPTNKVVGPIKCVYNWYCHTVWDPASYCCIVLSKVPGYQCEALCL